MTRMIESHVIVILDDEPSVLSALRRCLALERTEILSTDSPVRAVHWVATREVSLVITDQRMPGVLGTELLDQVSRISPSTARIILTAYPESTYPVPGVRRRTECLISKPWDPGMLRRTVRQLLHDRALDLAHEKAMVSP